MLPLHNPTFVKPLVCADHTEGQGRRAKCIVTRAHTRKSVVNL